MRYLFLLLLAISSPVFAQHATLFQNVKVFDGTKVLPNTNVLIDGEKIVAVGKNVKCKYGDDIIDGRGRTLLPGLIDAHAHVYGSALEDAIEAGVTTELDMFTDPQMAAQVRADQAAGRLLDKADLFSAGTLVTKAGGHGTEYGIPIPTLASADSAQTFVDARISEGSDYIKIVYDNGAVFGRSIPTLSIAELKAVVNAAHARKKLAVVHISSLEGARVAVEAGADGLMHVSSDTLPDATFISLLKQHKVFVVPTLSVIRSATGNSNASIAKDTSVYSYLTQANRASLEKSFPTRPDETANYEIAVSTVRMLKHAGIPILAGTDAPNPGTAHGISLHREMELLHDAGMSLQEVLASATSGPAKAFHLNDRGVIAPGKRADLLLVNGDPTSNILATRNIVAVYKRGHKLDRSQYLAKVVAEHTAMIAARSKHIPIGSENGAISDFEDGTASSKFGVGWAMSLDGIAGGGSTGTDSIVPGGANGSKYAMKVVGTVDTGYAYPWSGVMFSPGGSPMSAANLSQHHAIRFWSKGDGAKYRLMVYTKHGGYMPSIQSFEATSEWKEYNFPYSKFDGIDGSDIMAIIFAAGPKLGKYWFELDNVRLE